MADDDTKGPGLILIGLLLLFSGVYLGVWADSQDVDFFVPAHGGYIDGYDNTMGATFILAAFLFIIGFAMLLLGAFIWC